MTDNRKLEELSWHELEQAVTTFIAADGPNTDDLAAEDFFALWAQFEQARQQRVVEVQGEIAGEEIVLSLASSTIGQITIDGPEIQLPDGTRIILNLKSRRRKAA